MFTGIIKAVGQIKTVIDQGSGRKVSVSVEQTPDFSLNNVALGDSITINGVCTTVVELQEQQGFFSVDLSAETLRCTTLGALKAQQKVNLEQALQLKTPLGGHLVSGHVDTVAKITAIQAQGDSTTYTLEVAPDLMRYIAVKGSVCIDGTSLTVNQIDDVHNCFCITIIPHTMAQTIFSQYQIGYLVNLEVDLLARYLERLYPSSFKSQLC